MKLSEVIGGEVTRMQGRVFKAREDLGFIDWCEKYLVLRSSETKDYQGKYRRRLVLPMARLWEEFWDNPEWRTLDLSKGSQSTASLHCMAGMVRQVANEPGNMVYAIHSADEAANMGRRLKALLEDCPETCGTLDEVASDDLANKVLRLPGMTIWLVGAGSAGAMASKPGVVIVANDEVDKHKEIKGEADSGDLLEQRGKTVGQFKQPSFSTPTDEDGQITKRARKGSCHKYHVPCPECGEFFIFEKDGLRFSHLQDLSGGYDFDEVLRLTHYECPHCEGKIFEGSREGMLEVGEWRATHFRVLKDPETGEERKVPNWKPGRMSGFHNDFLSMWSNCSFGHLAMDIIEAGNNPRKIHNIQNNRFGLPFKQGGMAGVELEHIYQLRAAYQKGDSYFEPEFVTFYADTQDDCWKYVICAWNKRRDCCVCDWGYSITWKELLERARDGVMYQGKRYRAQFCLVDEGGHRTREVRRNAMGFRPWLFPAKGLGGIQVRTTLDWKEFDVDKEGIEKVPVVVYDDDGFKRECYRQYVWESAKRARLGKKFGDDPAVYFPTDIDEDFAKELTHERYEKVGSKWKWVQTGTNDFGDGFKGNFIAYAALKASISGK